MRRVSPESWTPRGVVSLEPAAEAVVHLEANALVVAGPGAGKTELLAQRASYLLETGLCAPPFRILAISFKRDAARNLRERVVRRCGAELARRFDSYTFDAWAKGLLDRFRLALPETHRPGRDYLIDFTFTYEDRLRQRLLEVSEKVGITAGQVHQLKVADFYRRFVAESPLNPAAATPAGTYQALAAALWHQTLHVGRSALTFQMIGALAELLLRANPTILAALRATYQFVFLDEFQDTTTNQYMLLHTAFASSPAVLTAVGDNKQRIMLWAGARRDVFDLFLAHFVAKRHGLLMNYRSAPRLIAIQRHLIAALDPTSPQPLAPPGSNPVQGECRVLVFPSDVEEARCIAELVAEWVSGSGVHPGEVCVLVRQTTDRMTEKLRSELSLRRVRSRVQDALQDLLAEPLAVAVLNAFYVSSKPSAPQRWTALTNSLLDLRGYEDGDEAARVAIEELASFVRELRERLAASATAQEVRARVAEVLAFFGESTLRLRFEQYLQDDFFQKTISDLSTQLAAARSANETWPEALDDFVGLHSVPLMTIHKSKGLEYHSIVVLGLEDYPFRNLAANNGEEECNFFVAFSRAKQRVVITSTSMRNGRPQGRTDVDRFFNLLTAAGVPTEFVS